MNAPAPIDPQVSQDCARFSTDEDLHRAALLSADVVDGTAPLSPADERCHHLGMDSAAFVKCVPVLLFEDRARGGGSRRWR